MKALIPVVVVLVLLGLATLPTSRAQPTQGTTAQYLPAVFKDGSSPTVTAPTSTVTPSVSRTPSATHTPTITSTPSATRTATATSTATPVPVTLLTNGSFEQGTMGWDISGGNVIVQTPPSFPAHSGIRAVMIDTRGQGIYGDIAEQQVTVPLGKPYLSYWVWVVSVNPVCGNENYAVGMSDYNGGPLLGLLKSVCTSTATEGWVKMVLDARIYEGKTVTVVIQGVATQGSLVFVDDIGWQSQL